MNQEECKKEEINHAESNAKAHAESIMEYYRAYKALEAAGEGASVYIDGGEFTDPDSVNDYVVNSVLSVEVRSGWVSAGSCGQMAPEEFRILLSWGGPACQIIGELDNGQVYGTPVIQHQDWGTYWTDYHPDFEDDSEWEEALKWFVECFYFEGH